MNRINIVLMGFGNVGKAFLQVVQEKIEYCQWKYGLDIQLHSIFRSDGALFSSKPLNPGSILENYSSASSFKKNPHWKSMWSLQYVLESLSPGVLVECTPSNIEDGEPGLTHIRQALDKKWHAVTANKGPLVIDFHGLKEKAQKENVALKISSATGAALPTLDVAQYSLAGAEIFQIEGILNGTTNYILTEMKKGIGYERALEEAKARGIAETDPTLDVGGWDTASKIILITNAVLGKNFSMNDVKVEGITEIPVQLLRKGREKGKDLKLLGKVYRKGEQFQLDVALTVIDDSHSLYGVDGTNKGITFITDTMNSVTVTGGKSDPKATGASLLKDIINIYRERY